VEEESTFEIVSFFDTFCITAHKLRGKSQIYFFRLERDSN
jgi:hypothetical protein